MFIFWLVSTTENESEGLHYSELPLLKANGCFFRELLNLC
uniref:Uncharacterized protein n=1 Tax=Rhizophora mucronata TaxID=61149 RepID=A0A2P2PAL3_RHIMU